MLIKGVLLAVLLVFLFRGGVRLLIVGWHLFLPMLVATLVYFACRQLLQKKKVSETKKEPIASGQPRPYPFFQGPFPIA
jgi:hypothetical protein